MGETTMMMIPIGHACLARDFPTGLAMTVQGDDIEHQTRSVATMGVAFHLVEEMMEVPSVGTAVALHQAEVTHTTTMVVVVVEKRRRRW